MAKLPKPYPPDCNLSGSIHHRPSSMPIIKPLEAPSTIKPGSISRAPEPTLVGRGVKRNP
jgi:hypothetical protein